MLKYIVTVGVLLFVALGLSWFVVQSEILSLFVNSNSESVTVPLEDDFDTKSYNPKGSLVLNMQIEEGDDKALFLFNVENNEINEVKEGYKWGHSTNDGELGIGSKAVISEGEVFSAIFLMTKDSQEVVYASSTQDTLFYKPRLSPDGTAYVFSAPPDLDETSSHEQRYTPSEWKIYLARTLESEPQFVLRGSSPVFSPDGGYLLYVADDGFHTYSLETGADEPVGQLATEKGLTYYMSDISHDGKRIAITSSPTQEVMIGDIMSWAPLTIDWTHRFPVLGYWPAFSPDGEYLAFQEFDWVDGRPGNRKVTIIDLATDDFYSVDALKYYTNFDFYLSDWVK